MPRSPRLKDENERKRSETAPSGFRIHTQSSLTHAGKNSDHNSTPCVFLQPRNLYKPQEKCKTTAEMTFFAPFAVILSVCWMLSPDKSHGGMFSFYLFFYFFWFTIVNQSWLVGIPSREHLADPNPYKAYKKRLFKWLQNYWYYSYYYNYYLLQNVWTNVTHLGAAVRTHDWHGGQP